MPRRLITYALAVCCLLACLFLIRAAGRAGASRLFSGFVVKASMMPETEPESLLPSAEEASRLTPTDPEAYRARGVAYLAMGKAADSAREYERAAALRPQHYLLWLDLGRARDQADDVEGAIVALREAVRLAPFFAQPRWQLANVLFRAGRYEEAFPELRRAIAGDSTLLPLGLELAWAASGGDVRAVEQLIQPTNSSARLTLARFLAKHGKALEAVQLFRGTGGINETDQRALLAELLATKKYSAAYEVWATGRAGIDNSNHGVGALTDGGFEGKISRNDPGFGWQANWQVATVRIMRDDKEKHEGSLSLRFEWNGNSNPLSQILTQLVVVEPNTHYRLRFSALTKDVVSGGLPVIAVSDANSAEYHLLGQSAPLKESEREWHDYEVEFKTGEATEAVLISLQRQPCPSEPCPIFGRLWLDAFSLQKG
ncbi:MAG TPA: tetratricopeptide repeat protein [Pyrinomonadaceae bacterium]